MFTDYSSCHKLFLEDEDSLQIACVKYLKQAGLLFTSCGLSEFLNTDEKRIKSVRMGYSVGIADLLIFHPNNSYSMLVIELKTPWGSGELSDEQCKTLYRFEKEGKAFVCVLNSIEVFVEIVTKYVNNLI